MVTSPRSPSKHLLSPKNTRIPDEALYLALQQFLDNWHFIIMKSSLGKTMDRREVLEMALHVLTMNGIRFTADEISELVQTEEEVMMYEVVDRIPESLREGFEHLTLELLVVVTTASRMRTTVENNEAEPIQAVMEKEGGTAFGQQTLKRAILQASTEVSKTIRCKATWGPDMAQRLARLKHATEIGEDSNRRLVLVEAALNELPGLRSAKAVRALNHFIENSRHVMLIAAWAGWVCVMQRSKAERNLTTRYSNELQAAEEELESFKARHLSNIRKVLQQNHKRDNCELVSVVMNDWREQAFRQKAEAWTEDKIKTVQLSIGRTTKEMCNRAKKVISRMVEDEKGAAVGSCFASWVLFSVAYKKDRDFEENLKHFERQMQVYKDKKKEDAALILSRVSAATDSGLVQQTLAAWTSYTFDGQKIRGLEGKVYGYDDRLHETKKKHRQIAANLSGRTGDQIDMNTMYQSWMAWTSCSKTARLDKFFGQKIDRKRRQLSNLQVLFQNFADELETGLGTREQEDESRPKADGVSLPDIHAKKHG